MVHAFLKSISSSVFSKARPGFELAFYDVRFCFLLSKTKQKNYLNILFDSESITEEGGGLGVKVIAIGKVLFIQVQKFYEAFYVSFCANVIGKAWIHLFPTPTNMDRLESRQGPLPLVWKAIEKS